MFESGCGCGEMEKTVSTIVEPDSDHALIIAQARPTIIYGARTAEAHKS